MIDILSDLIAYPIVGLLSMLSHVLVLGADDDVSLETYDRMDEMTKPNMVARWRYKINHALGGTRTYEDYNQQKNQELISCGCGCGCGLLAIGFGLLIFVLFLLTL